MVNTLNNAFIYELYNLFIKVVFRTSIVAAKKHFILK